MEKKTAKIISRNTIAEETTEIVFRCIGDSFVFLPGQYVEVTLPKLLYPDQRGNFRNFSIVSSPNRKREISVAFRNSESGFKRTLLKTPLGSEVEFQGPLGVFTLPESSERPVVCIAGGIGITPFLSMIRFASEEELQQQITLLYANSKRKRAAYIHELEALEEKNSHFNLEHKLGYFDLDFIRKHTGGLTRPLWYIAGPPDMVRSARYLLQEHGVPDEDVRVEVMLYHKYKSKISSRTGQAKNTDSGLSKVRAGKMFDITRIAPALLQALDKTALVAMTDAEGRIMFVNHAFIEVSKYSHSELMGQNHRILKSGFHPPEFYDSLWETISAGSVWKGEIKNRAKDGSYYWVDTTISPVFNRKREITSYLAVRYPITKRKKAEEEIEKRTEELTSLVASLSNNAEQLKDTKKAMINLLEDIEEEKTAIEERVRERTAELEKEKDKLLQVTHNMKGGAILLDRDCKVVFTNGTAKTLLGPKTKDLDDLFWFFIQ